MDNTLAEIIPTLSCTTKGRKGYLLLSGLFTEILRQFYSATEFLPNNIQGWVSDKDCNGKASVYINTSQVFDPSAVNTRPAVIVDLDGLNYTPIKSAGLNVSHLDLTTGAYEYTSLVTGRVTFVHLGRSRTEALSYADYTHDVLTGFADIVRSDFSFESFNVSAILKASRRKQEVQDWAAPVIVDFSFYESTVTEMESQKLKSISLSISESLN